MAWEDNFNKLVEMSHPIDEKQEWKLTIEEHKKKGTLHINIRSFKTTESYTGPTKNGIAIQVNSVQELEQFQVSLNQFFNKAKEML